MNKTTLLILSFFIRSFLSTLPLTPAFAATTTDAVLDLDKNPLRTGVNYYILPVLRGPGGGLTLTTTTTTTNNTCKVNVAQDKFETSKGIPLSFHPVTLKKGIVRVSTDHNIKFSSNGPRQRCPISSTVWKLDNFDELTKQWFVTVGGVLGNPGRTTTGNWFKIEKQSDYYKLVFCPSVCSFCKVVCMDVGIFIKDGRRYLALSDVPFMVVFKKA